MSVPFDIPRGTRVRVWFGYQWWDGTVVESAKDNDRNVVVYTDKAIEKSGYLDGHGLSVGNRSAEIELVEMK